MLLPGLSGSFVLILMGNYQLIMLTAIPEGDLSVIAPVAIGALVGFIALSHFISYMLKKHELTTIGTLTGFILGSLLIIWPWKSEVFLKDEAGEFLIKKGEKIVMGYEWFLPSFSDGQTIISIVLMIVGAALVLLLDKFGNSKSQADN
jgi:putative membrane protein